MKFESKSETPFHRVVSGISIILQGVLTVRHSKSEDLLLHPGDSIAVSFSIDSKWKLINGGTTEVLLALVKMK